MARSVTRRKKGKGGDDRAGLEPVTGGKVRRMVFQGQKVESRGDRRYVPRHTAPLREIEREIDDLGGRSSRRWRRVDDDAHEDTIYTTRRGRIEAAEAEEPVAGRRRVLYLRPEDRPAEGRRFSTVLVDKIIKDVTLEERSGTRRTSTRSADKPAAAKKAAEPKKAPKKTAKKAANKTAKKTPKKTAKKKAAKKTAAKKTAKKASKKTTKKGKKESYPAGSVQCFAITNSGKQCRNSNRQSSKYCSSHKGYHAKSLESHLKGMDTKPTHKGTGDTLPDAKVQAGETVQCVALTKAGKQCRNASKTGNKYCASHKGYRGKTAVLESMDTEPRNKKAKDTKPSLRK